MSWQTKGPRFWVGHKGGKRTPFTFPAVPTPETHGHLYAAIVGPFKTRRGAEWDARNPGFYGSIEEAERLAKAEGPKERP